MKTSFAFLCSAWVVPLAVASGHPKPASSANRGVSGTAERMEHRTKQTSRRWDRSLSRREGLLREVSAALEDCHEVRDTDGRATGCQAAWETFKAHKRRPEN